MFMKFMSRKLLVLVAATALLYFGKITPDLWSYVAMTYLGAQALLDSKVSKKQ